MDFILVIVKAKQEKAVTDFHVRFNDYLSIFFTLFRKFPCFSLYSNNMVLTHAGVDAFNRYLSTTVGREKLCRLVQYFARFYAFYLLRNGAPKDTVQRWVDLKTHLGNGRKFFRLLKPVEFAQTGIKSLAIKDEVLRFTAVAKQIGMMLYYITEVFVLVRHIEYRIAY